MSRPEPERPPDYGEIIGSEEPYFSYSATLRIWGDSPEVTR